MTKRDILAFGILAVVAGIVLQTFTTSTMLGLVANLLLVLGAVLVQVGVVAAGVALGMREFHRETT